MLFIQKNFDKIIDKIKIEKGCVIKLSGEMGSGKTTFARYFINKLASEPVDVVSPSFSILEIYEFKSITVFHYDMQRLENVNQVWDLSFEEAVSSGVVLVEWPDIIKDLKLNNVYEVFFNERNGEYFLNITP